MDVLRTPDSNFEGLADFAFEPHYVDIGGLRMHYLDEGPRDAPIMLMMHGMPTWSYLYRHIIVPMVAAGYRCIAPDHIGFGRSDKVTDPAWYNIARHTSNMAAFVEQLNLQQVTIMVQDWGGPIGLAQVAAMPERFERLVIMNTWLHHEAYEYSPAIIDWIERNKPGGLLRDNIPGLFSYGGLMAMATRRIAPQDSVLKVMQGQAPEYEGEAEATRRAYDAPFDGLGEEAVTGPRRFPLSIPHHDPVSGDAEQQGRNFALINATSRPVHFIWGGSDFVFTTEWGQQWASLIPHATWDLLPDASHFLQDTHGAEIADIVLGRIG